MLGPKTQCVFVGFESSGKMARRFAVDLNGNFYLGIHWCNSDSPTSKGLHFLHGKVRPRIDAVEFCQRFHTAQIAHGDQIKLAIVQGGLGANLHPTPEKSPVSDGA